MTYIVAHHQGVSEMHLGGSRVFRAVIVTIAHSFPLLFFIGVSEYVDALLVKSTKIGFVLFARITGNFIINQLAIDIFVWPIIYCCCVYHES